MAYVNPGSLMINPSGPGSAHHYSVVSNPPPHPSVMHADMPEYWVLPDGREVARLPRPLNYTPPMETFPPITFSVRGWPGVRIKDLKVDNPIIVDDPYATPMAHLGWRATVLNLEWPGYPRSTYNDPQIARFDVMTSQGPITRQGIALVVASAVRLLCNAKRNKPIAAGFEQWSIKDGSIHPSDVVLLSIHYYRTQWIPELYLFE